MATIFALLLPVLLGFTALAMEVGFWFSERQRMQIASDTAAYSALISYSADKSTTNAVAKGIGEARASGFDGPNNAISITIYPASGGRPAYSDAQINDAAPLFLTRLFLPSDVVPISVRSYASLATSGPASCLLALDSEQSRSILIAASVSVVLKDCIAVSNSTKGDALWLEGTAKLSTDCVSTPGGISWNGGASITLKTCTLQSYPRVAHPDPYSSTPFWGGTGVTSPSYFADASISQGRYGPGMPGGATLQPGKYGKQVEIAGDVHLQPGVYYFTNGFRAPSGGTISGTGVTLMFDQTKTIDVAQSVKWNITAPTTGATAGIALMGDPTKKTNSDVRLINVMGNVAGVVYFPNQRLLTEAGPNTTPSKCTIVVAKRIDIRGSGTVNNDCSNATGTGGSGSTKVRLVPAPPAGGA